MRYDFLILGGPANLVQGQAEGYEPSVAALSAVNAECDLLDGLEGALAPIVTIERDPLDNGVFKATIDYHDDAPIWVRLAEAD